MLLYTATHTTCPARSHRPQAGEPSVSSVSSHTQAKLLLLQQERRGMRHGLSSPTRPKQATHTPLHTGKALGSECRACVVFNWVVIGRSTSFEEGRAGQERSLRWPPFFFHFGRTPLTWCVAGFQAIARTSIWKARRREWAGGGSRALFNFAFLHLSVEGPNACVVIASASCVRASYQRPPTYSLHSNKHIHYTISTASKRTRLSARGRSLEWQHRPIES